MRFNTRLPEWFVASEINNEDKENIKFSTCSGLHKFIGIAFSLCTAPATFSGIDIFLRGLQSNSFLV